VEYDNGKHAVVAPFSDKKEPGTFHFAEASAKPELTSEAKKMKEKGRPLRNESAPRVRLRQRKRKNFKQE
jgi:hypothetical protein